MTNCLIEQGEKIVLVLLTIQNKLHCNFAALILVGIRNHLKEAFCNISLDKNPNGKENIISGSFFKKSLDKKPFLLSAKQTPQTKIYHVFIFIFKF